MASGVKTPPQLPKKITDNLGDIPFDQFSRQFIVFQAVERLRTKKQLKILDVGGYGGKTREFFPQDDVLVVDLFDIDEPGYQRADALALPFKDNQFDIVMSFDVLEHISKENREKFLLECTRVSKTATMLAAPFYSKAATQSEFALNYYHKTLTGKPHRWLAEHIEYSLPRREKVEEFWTKNKFNFIKIHSNNLETWTWLQYVILLTATGDTSSQYLAQLYSFYNQNLHNLDDHAENCYREVYIASQDVIPADLAAQFTNHDSWEAQLKLRETAFLHLAQIRDNLKHHLVSVELSWYKAMNQKQRRDINTLLLQKAHLESQLGMIGASKGWRAIKLVRKIRQRLIPGRKT